MLLLTASSVALESPAEGGDANGVIATGIGFFDERGRHVTLQDTRDFVLSGRLQGSPKLLMLSGLAPEEYVRKHGLSVMLRSVDLRDSMSVHSSGTDDNRNLRTLTDSLALCCAS